jgi:hypothetical protein
VGGIRAEHTDCSLIYREMKRINGKKEGEKDKERMGERSKLLRPMKNRFTEEEGGQIRSRA